MSGDKSSLDRMTPFKATTFCAFKLLTYPIRLQTHSLDVPFRGVGAAGAVGVPRGLPCAPRFRIPWRLTGITYTKLFRASTVKHEMVVLLMLTVRNGSPSLF